MPNPGDKMPDRRQPPDPETLIDPKTGRRLYARPDWVPQGAAARILRVLVAHHQLTVPLVSYALQGERIEHGRQKGRQAQFTPSHCGHVLTKLWRYGFVRRYYRPVEPGLGSAANVYLPTSAGAKLVLEPQDWLRERKKIANRAAHPSTRYEHGLGIAQFRLMWQRGAPAQADLFDTETWWSDRELQFTVRVDTVDAARCDRRDCPHWPHRHISPDAAVLAAILPKADDPKDEGYFKPLFVEVETTHKNYARLRAHFRAYRDLVTDERTHKDQVVKVIEQQTGIVPAFGAVVFLTPTEVEAERLCRFAYDVLEIGTKKTPLFWFGSLDQFTQARVRGNLRTGKQVTERVMAPPETLFQPVFRNVRGERGAFIV